MRRLWLLVLLGACAGDGRTDEVPEAPLHGEGQPEVLISTESGLIGRIADLVVGEDGTVYAVDRQASQVHVIRGATGVRTMGRPGAGPGEFAQPSTVYPHGDTLLVVDWGNGRLQGLDSSGSPLFTRPLPPGQAPSIGAEGRFVRPSWGMDTMLAVIHAPDLTEIAPIGHIVGTPASLVSPRRMKQEIQEGNVPEIFLNTAVPVVATDGSVWLYVAARGSVQRFDPTGHEESALTLEEPESQMLFDQFVEENAAKPGSSFAGLEYILDGTVVAGDFWALLGVSRSGGAAIRIIHPNGTLGARLEFPGVIGATQMAIDIEGGWAYFVRGEQAELVRVPLEPDDTPPITFQPRTGPVRLAHLDDRGSTIGARGGGPHRQPGT